MLKQVVIAVTLIVSNIVALQLFEERIFGGEEAQPGQFPHQISLRLLRESFRHICGGSIISDRFILTAAHCYPKAYPNVTGYRVVVGAHLYNGDDGKAYDVLRIIPHEHYNHSTLINDVALIEVNETIVFNDRVAPISLNREFIGGDVLAVASGWGRTDNNNTNLKFAELKTLTNDECRLITEQEPDDDPIHDFETLCVYSGRNGTGMCSGDSGGPLVHNGELIGVTSWAFLCARGLPDGFARVSVFVDWIEEHMK